jgi:hypothetical protein
MDPSATLVLSDPDPLAKLAELSGVPVAHGIAESCAMAPGLRLQALELRDGGPARQRGRRPVDALAVYLVTANAPDPESGFALLIRTARTVQADGDMLVDLVPPTPAMWQALGATPRPAWNLLIPLATHPEPPAPTLVEEPLRVEMSPLNRSPSTITAEI